MITTDESVAAIGSALVAATSAPRRAALGSLAILGAALTGLLGLTPDATSAQTTNERRRGRPSTRGGNGTKRRPAQRTADDRVPGSPAAAADDATADPAPTEGAQATLGVARNRTKRQRGKRGRPGPIGPTGPAPTPTSVGEVFQVTAPVIILVAPGSTTSCSTPACGGGREGYSMFATLSDPERCVLTRVGRGVATCRCLDGGIVSSLT